MFDQTFIPSHREPASAGSWVLSLTLQVAGLAAAMLLSLISTHNLSVGALHTMLIAPITPIAATRPLSSAPVSVIRAENRRFFSSSRLVTLSARPTRTAESSREAPDIDIGPISYDGSALGDAIGAPGLPAAAPVNQQAANSKKRSGPVHVGGAVAAANLVQQVTPIYPRIAIAAGISGTVEFSAVIDRSGSVTNLRPLRGHPLLVKAATDAVLKWRYRPTLLNGEPVEVITDITVRFNLSAGMR